MKTVSRPVNRARREVMWSIIKEIGTTDRPYAHIAEDFGVTRAWVAFLGRAARNTGLSVPLRRRGRPALHARPTH